jgi:hypothetical protein
MAMSSLVATSTAAEPPTDLPWLKLVSVKSSCCMPREIGIIPSLCSVPKSLLRKSEEAEGRRSDKIDVSHLPGIKKGWLDSLEVDIAEYDWLTVSFFLAGALLLDLAERQHK